MMSKLKFFGKTDVGMVRTNNEDNFVLKTYGDVLVAGVADGMGGHFAGEVASEIAVKTVEEFFDKKLSENEIFEIIEDAFFNANKKIFEESKKKGPKVMMGTTMTLAVLEKDGSEKYKVHYGHIGDSKLYHLVSDDIVQKSVDHTMLQRMIDAGALTKDEIENYAHKNIIYKSLGGKEHLDMDEVKTFELGEGEAILLCSDGLSGYLKPEEMHSIVKHTKDVKEAVNYMIELAKYRGGDDNITVILVENGKFKRDKSKKLEKIKVKKPKKNRQKMILYLLFLMLIIVIGALGYFGYKELKKIDKDIRKYKKSLETQSVPQPSNRNLNPKKDKFPEKSTNKIPAIPNSSNQDEIKQTGKTNNIEKNVNENSGKGGKTEQKKDEKK